jgi:exoribonuclease R
MAGRASTGLHTVLYFRANPATESGYVLRLLDNRVVVLVPRFGVRAAQLPVFLYACIRALFVWAQTYAWPRCCLCTLQAACLPVCVTRTCVGRQIEGTVNLRRLADAGQLKRDAEGHAMHGPRGEKIRIFDRVKVRCMSSGVSAPPPVAL